MTILPTWRSLIWAALLAAFGAFVSFYGDGSDALIKAAGLAFMSFVAGAIYQGYCDMDAHAALRREHARWEETQRKVAERREKRRRVRSGSPDDLPGQ